MPAVASVRSKTPFGSDISLTAFMVGTKRLSELLPD